MIPYTDDSGLRNYRADVTTAPAPRWPWLLALTVVAFLAGLALGVGR